MTVACSNHVACMTSVNTCPIFFVFRVLLSKKECWPCHSGNRIVCCICIFIYYIDMNVYHIHTHTMSSVSAAALNPNCFTLIYTFCCYCCCCFCCSCFFGWICRRVPRLASCAVKRQPCILTLSGRLLNITLQIITFGKLTQSGYVKYQTPEQN